MEKLDVNSIKIGKRFRQDLGDLAAMGRSLQEVGQLQPIGVDDKNNLVFGQRRLVAVKELKWPTIDAVRINLVDIISGEYHENEMRKQFTISERVAIADAVKERIGNRQGKRTDLAKISPQTQEDKEDVSLVDRGPQVEEGEKTRETAADFAGMGSDRSYRDAKNVKEDGIPELIKAMDEGKVSVTKAAKIAGKKTPEAQKKALEAALKPKKPRKKKADKPDKADEKPEDETLKDELDEPVPPGLNSIFKKSPDFKEIVKQLRDVEKKIKELQQVNAGAKLERSIVTDIENARRAIELDAAPYAVCPVCKGIAKNRAGKCHCKERGWISENTYKTMPAEYRQ